MNLNNETNNEYKSSKDFLINQQIFNQKYHGTIIIDIKDDIKDDFFDVELPPRIIIGENLIFLNLYDMYNYIKSNSYYDGTYWSFKLKKDGYNIIFVMRTIKLIYETIFSYHMTKII